MIYPKDSSSDQGLGREALGVFQEAISPSWLLQVIKGTSVVLFILVVLAFAL